MGNSCILSRTILALILAGGICGQTGFRPAYEFGEARFAIEIADFRSAREDFNRLEIYYKVFYDGLSYNKTDTGYEAYYDVSLVVEGKDGVQLEGLTREGEIKVENYGDTRRSTDFIINMVAVEVPANQNLAIRAIFNDRVAKTSYQIDKHLDRHNYWGKYPSLSRIEFVREISPVEKDSKFNKDSLRIIPSVGRLFGGENDSLLLFYQEIYPGQHKDKSSRKIFRIYHRVKGFVYSDTAKLGSIEEPFHKVCSLNVSGLMPGYYELEVRLEGRRGRLYSKVVEEFELELTAESIFRTDYETAVAMLKYLANPGEYGRLKEAKTGDERRQVWDQFWRNHEEQGHTRENPTRHEFFRRIRHSNRYFSIMKREGWKTSRGMVYITYGEPDEVDDYPFELSTKPYQVWSYYKSNPPRTFTFVDEWGNGDYELQPPYNGIGF